MSLSDSGIPMTMPIQPANSNSGGFGGWGGEGSWFIILFLIFAMFGWGGYGGFGGFGGNGGGSGVVDGYVLTSDFANIERKLDGVNSGLCDGFYQQAQLINGVNLNMNNGFMTAELSRANQQAALMQQLNAMAMQNQQIFAAQLAASQAAQNDTLKNYVSGQFAYYNPRPVPSFAVPAPYQYAGCGCGC